MSEVTNEKRAEWAQTALDAFMSRTHQNDPWEALGDLMGDFMHLVAMHADEIDGGATGYLKLDPHPGVELLQRFFDRGDDYYRDEVNEHTPAWTS